MEERTMNEINDTVPNPSSYRKISMKQKTGRKCYDLSWTKWNDNLELWKAKFTPLEIAKSDQATERIWFVVLIPVIVADRIEINRNHREDAE